MRGGFDQMNLRFHAKQRYDKTENRRVGIFLVAKFWRTSWVGSSAFRYSVNVHTLLVDDLGPC